MHPIGVVAPHGVRLFGLGGRMLAQRMDFPLNR